MNIPTHDMLRYLKNFISETRLKLFEDKIVNRTKHITLVLEDIYQSQNISAVIRSADCFGIQDVHVIENHNFFQDNTEISMGASKWINIKRYNTEKRNTINAINTLKANDYQIIVTTPHNADLELFDLNIVENKTAIVFGSEVDGCSKEVLEIADKKIRIPMYGFTESFNVSVAVSLCLQYLTYKIRKSNVDWKMSKMEQENVLLEWFRNSIKSVEEIEKRYIKDLR